MQTNGRYNCAMNRIIDYSMRFKAGNLFATKPDTSMALHSRDHFLVVQLHFLPSFEGIPYKN